MAALRSAVVVLVTTLGVAHAADVRVLATSGTVVDGVGIARFESPLPFGDGAVVSRGITTALSLPTLRLATGDPLPAPLRGSVNEITQAAAAGPLVGILADTNGPDAADAIFVADEHGLQPLVTIAPADPTDILHFALTAERHLAYLIRTPDVGGIVVRPPAGPPQLVHEFKRSYAKRTVGPVIAATGAVAWAPSANKKEVFAWDAGHGLREIAILDRLARTRKAYPPLAIHPSGGVAIITKDEAILVSTASDTTTVLARRKDRVGTGRITRFTSVGFDTDGTVVLGVRVSRTPDLFLRGDGVILTSATDTGFFSA